MAKSRKTKSRKVKRMPRAPVQTAVSNGQVEAAVMSSLLHRSSSAVLTMTVVALGVAILMILGYRQWLSRTYGTTTPFATENSTANVGGGSLLNINHKPLKKQKQCYSDADCPDGTGCTEHGICSPVLSELPESGYESLKKEKK